MPNAQPGTQTLPGKPPRVSSPDGPLTPPRRCVQPHGNTSSSFIAVMSERASTIRPSSATEAGLSSASVSLSDASPASPRRSSLPSRPSTGRCLRMQVLSLAGERIGAGHQSGSSSLVCRRVGDRISLALASSSPRSSDASLQRHSAPARRKADSQLLPATAPTSRSPNPPGLDFAPLVTTREANLLSIRVKHALLIRNLQPPSRTTAAAACPGYPRPLPANESGTSLNFLLPSTPPPHTRGLTTLELFGRIATTSLSKEGSSAAIALQLMSVDADPQAPRTSRRPSRLSQRSSFPDTAEEGNSPPEEEEEDSAPEEEEEAGCAPEEGELTLRLQRLGVSGGGTLAALDTSLQLWPQSAV